MKKKLWFKLHFISDAQLCPHFSIATKFLWPGMKDDGNLKLQV